MGIAEVASLIIVMLTLALIPSTSVALVVTRSVTHGIKNGIAVSLGIVLGDIIFILMAIVGLSIISETIGWLFLTIKYIGAIYLIWLGFSLIKSNSVSAITVKNTDYKGSLVASFLSGLFITLGDVKAIFFYISLFPAFVNLETLNFVDIMVITLVTIMTVGGVKLFYVFSAYKVTTISKGFNVENKVKKVAGSFMLAAGSYLIIKP